ncbi:MAG: hypothetical protein ACOYCD_06865 [Kiritimatiellia bacterium]|jgi:hypothetical protein
MQNKTNNRPLPSVSPTCDADGCRWLRYLLWGVAALAAILALSAMFISAESSGEINRLASQWTNNFAAVIVRNKVVALWHAAGMAAVAAGFLALLIWKRSVLWARIAAWVLVALVAVDAVWLSRHYIKPMPLSALAENDIVRLLQTDQPDRRAALLMQDGFYNFWLTYLFPYYNIRTVNVSQMPRMPNDYKRFLEAVGRDPVRYWQLMGVGYVLGPSQLWAEIRNNPALLEAFDPVYAYNVAPSDDGMSVTVIPATEEQPGQHVVLRLKLPAPRYVLIAGWRAAEDADALNTLASASSPLFQEVLVAPEHADKLPAPCGTGMTGVVQRVEYRSGYMRLRVSAPTDCILRVSEKYDSGWRAWVDDESAPVCRVDYLFQGVPVPFGVHEVVLRHDSDWWSLALQVVAMVVCLAAAIRFLTGRRIVPSDQSV